MSVPEVAPKQTYYERNRDAVLAKSKAYYAAHRDAILTKYHNRPDVIAIEAHRQEMRRAAAAIRDTVRSQRPAKQTPAERKLMVRECVRRYYWRKKAEKENV